MNKYSVSIIFDASKCVEVNAESPEEALDLACDEAGYVSLCYQCSGEVEVGDAVRAIVYDESGREVVDDRYQSMEIAKITQQRDELLEVMEDHDRLVRELDVLLNGVDGDAKQASLCDLVAQLKVNGVRHE